MKKIYLFILTILTLCLTSCRQDTTQFAKDEFSKYYNGKIEVALVHNDIVHMEKNKIDLSTLVEDNEYNNGLIIKQNTLLFSTCVENKKFNFTLNIYESSFLGTKVKLLFSKEGFRTHPWTYAINDCFYIEHYLNGGFDTKSKRIDKYTISSNVYETIDRGKDCSLSDYFQEEEQSRYSIEMIKNESIRKHGKFVITDSKTGIKKTIDDDYLKNTIYIESMEIFNYAPKRFDISNGHILLTYWIGAGDGWNNSHLVFEYDYESNALEYKLLAFPCDDVAVEITYIG